MAGFTPESLAGFAPESLAGFGAESWQGLRRNTHYHKRLERGLFEIPVASSDGRHMRISSEQLSLILHGIRLSSVVRNKRFTLRSKGYPQKVNESR